MVTQPEWCCPAASLVQIRQILEIAETGNRSGDNIGRVVKYFTVKMILTQGLCVLNLDFKTSSAKLKGSITMKIKDFFKLFYFFNFQVIPSHSEKNSEAFESGKFFSSISADSCSDDSGNFCILNYIHLYDNIV